MLYNGYIKKLCISKISNFNFILRNKENYLEDKQFYFLLVHKCMHKKCFSFCWLSINLQLCNLFIVTIFFFISIFIFILVSNLPPCWTQKCCASFSQIQIFEGKTQVWIIVSESVSKGRWQWWWYQHCPWRNDLKCGVVHVVACVVFVFSNYLVCSKTTKWRSWRSWLQDKVYGIYRDWEMTLLGCCFLHLHNY